jgi:two-component system KDP operon response regulator KdpE
VSALGPLVLVVEDELQMRRFLRASLASHGFNVVEAATANEGLAAATNRRPELVLLDLSLPDDDGMAVIRRLREWSSTPIIIISGRRGEADKVEGLDAGADDYLAKPFAVGELLARIRVALRHAQQGGGAPGLIVEVGPLRVDLSRREVHLRDRQLHLTPIEYRLLAVFAQNAGKVLTHNYLLKEVWGEAHAGEAHYLRFYMASLRRKLEVEPARPTLLMTEVGVGYRLRDQKPIRTPAAPPGS